MVKRQVDTAVKNSFFVKQKKAGLEIHATSDSGSQTVSKSSDIHGQVSLSQGSGGREMQALIDSLVKGLYPRNLKKENSGWSHMDNDSAIFGISKKDISEIAFTADSFIVSPPFFPGGNIGDLAFAGTVNDLLMMGADPVGLSLSLVLEEGLSYEVLHDVMQSIHKLSENYKIPVVTGDTKVMEKGKIDKIIINTSGIGLLKKNCLLDKGLKEGDKIIISGGIGEHAVALLSERFEYETSLLTDSKPLVDEIKAVRENIKQAKDPTRGGIAACLNELCKMNDVGMLLDEKSIPIREEVHAVTEMLGLNPYELACEGRFVCICADDMCKDVLEILKSFNPDASVIGEVTGSGRVIVKTEFGERLIPSPSGNIVPRIC